LSQTIQALEASLGVALFTRTNRSVALTPAGHALLPEARRLLQQAEGLPDLARRAAAGETGRLALAFVSTADYSVLPALLRRFREAYPAVAIELREATSDVQQEYLLEGRIDAGLLIPPLSDKAAETLHYRRVLAEPLVVALPQGLRGTGRGALRLDKLRDQPLIIFPRHIAPGLYDAIMAAFHDAGVTPIIAQEAIQMQTIVGLVSAGMGIALVPQSVSNLRRPGVEYRPLAGKAPLVETGLAWRHDNTQPVLQAFLELIANS